MRIVVAIFTYAPLTIHMFEMRMRVCIENGNAILLKRGKSMSRRSRRERGRPGQHGQRIIDRDAFYIKETPNKGMLITCFDDICDVNLKYDVLWKGGGGGTRTR